MFTFFFELVLAYLQNFIILVLLFGAFNMFTSTGFTLDAFKFSSAEKKVLFIVPAVNLLISIFVPGFVGTMLSVIAFVVIYAYFTGHIGKYRKY